MKSVAPLLNGCSARCERVAISTAFLSKRPSPLYPQAGVAPALSVSNSPLCHPTSHLLPPLYPQAGVAPSLTVWNSLLGAYGRAGSVDAAYAAWLRMLESGERGLWCSCIAPGCWCC